MQNDLITRLRAVAGTPDNNMHNFLLEAASELERFEFAGRWSADCAKQADDARKEAMAEVERLKAQNIMLVEFGSAWAQKAGADDQAFDYLSEQLSQPKWCLAEIQARAIESILNDLRADMPDTNTARRIFQRLQLRVDVLRAKQPITNPTENSSQLVIGDSNGDQQA